MSNKCFLFIIYGERTMKKKTLKITVKINKNKKQLFLDLLNMKKIKQKQKNVASSYPLSICCLSHLRYISYNTAKN